MYELVQVSEHDYYIDCPAKMGLVRINDTDAVLIDSGSDKDAGKKALRILESNGWHLAAIYNTHSHADHIGGNRFLQDRTGCSIYARGIEHAYANFPVLEPTGLYGGLPFNELKHKFLLAQESRVLPLTEDVLPEGMKMLDLSGHSPEMTGFLTKDGTAYVADSVLSEETLSKHGIGYLFDPDTAISALNYIKTVDAKVFVPSHAAATESISALADVNIRAIEAVKETVIGMCKAPLDFDTLLKMIFDNYGLTMTPQQYVLIGSTLRSYLSSLCGSGKMAYEFSDNRMLWKSTEQGA